jgi:hypothetical protein
VRFATWNLERADPSRPVGEVQREAMSRVAADVWVLTEALPSAVRSGYRTALSAPMLTEDGGRFTVVAAERLTCMELPEVPTRAAALVEVDGSAWLVVGVCTPWRAGAPALPPEAAPQATTGTEQWIAVLDGLDRGLRRLAVELPDVPVLLAGDFNQTLTGYVVGSHNGRIGLTQLLDAHRLIAYTDALPSAREGCATIDQLCWSGPAERRRVVDAPGRARPQERCE